MKVTKPYKIWLKRFNKFSVYDEQTSPCRVSLPHNTRTWCRVSRERDLNQQRKIYQLDSRPGLPMPLVNVSIRALVGQLLAEPFTRQHTQLYIGLTKKTSELAKHWIQLNPDEITEYSGYERIFNFFKSKLQNKEVIIYIYYFITLFTQCL